MSRILDTRDEDRVCSILKTYVDEWGWEYVRVLVPKKWLDFTIERRLGSVELLFTTDNTIEIEVTYPGCFLSFVQELKEV